MSWRSRFHLTVLIMYALLTPVAVHERWLNSVAFVSVLSIWALVESRWGAFEASRSRDEERPNDEDMERLQ